MRAEILIKYRRYEKIWVKCLDFSLQPFKKLRKLIYITLNDKLRVTTGTNFILKMISRIFLTSTFFTFLVGLSHQERLHENSHLFKEDYVEYERPKETLSETIFHKKIRGLVYLPKTVPKWILDVIPFYGKNFKTQSSESSGYR